MSKAPSVRRATASEAASTANRSALTGTGDAGSGARQRRHFAVVAVVAEARVDRGDAGERGRRRGVARRSRVGVGDDADERAHVGRARLDPDRIGPDPDRRRIRSARTRRRHERQRGDRGGAALHSVTPGIGTGGVGIGPQSSFAGIRLGIASACSQVTTPPW